MRQEPGGDGAISTKFIAECLMPTALGRFRMRSYRYSNQQNNNKLEPIVVVHGDVAGCENVIVRVHDQCFTSEVFGSKRCDCREQLLESLKLIRRETGIVIYLQQEGRGIGVSNKVAAYSLQDAGMDTVDANLHLGFQDEQREYASVPAILQDMGIKSVRLITNNPFKIEQLTALGVRITDRITLNIPTNEHNIEYIRSKRDKMNHIYPADLASPTSSSAEAFDSFFQQTAGALSDGSAPRGGPETRHHAVDLAGGAAAESPDAVATPPANYLANLSEDQLELHRRGYAFGRKSVEDALMAIREGRIVAVVDDEDRENEGDLIMAAEKATPETIGFIVRYTSGVLCAGMQGPRLDSLALPPMVVNNEDPKQTAYSVSVDCRHGTTTGISAADRAMTFRALADPTFHATDFQRPGHVFPLRYRQGGVLVRAGHTEASVDLARLAGLHPAGVLAELVNDDGSIMRLPGIKALAVENDIVLTSVQDIIAYRLETGR